MTKKRNHIFTFLLITITLLVSDFAVFGFDYSLKDELQSRITLKDKYFYLDSLITYTSKEKSTYFEAVLLKFEILRQEKKDVQALNELKKILENEHSSHHPELLGEAYLHTSEIYSQDKSYDLAQTYLTEAYIIFDGINAINQKALTLVKSAKIHKRDKNYSLALKYLKQAHDNYLEQGKVIESIELAKEIGTTAYEAGEFNEAEQFFTSALSGFRQLNDTVEQVRILESLSTIYGFEKRFQEKINTEKSLIDLCESAYGTEKTAKHLIQLSNTYGTIGRNRDALKTQEKAFRYINEKSFDQRYEALLRLSELYQLNERGTDAILALHKANNLALNSENKSKIISSSKVIADFYKARGDWEKAHTYLSISDSISRALLETKIRKLENSPYTYAPTIKKGEAAAVKADPKWPLNGWKTTLFTLSISLSIILVFVIYYIRKRKKIRQILEWKVYKRTNELRDLNSELNTYIYKSSHDLRNPLTSIKSLITLLKTETNPTQLLKYTTLIESCANQMDEILLNLSRAVDYKKIEPKIEQINFSDIKNNLEFTSNSDKTKGLDISWHIREKAPFFSDPSLIGVILKKTILNSMQYRLGSSSDYCKISITTDSSGASVCIEDNGQGIATKVKDSVFDMFVKGTHKSKGAGLGLYLVKIASDKLRGKISLESEESKGAKLVFNLPNLA